MISVLLIILKIIGITLLVIIGLILLLLLLVLFVPVRYRFKGSYDEKFLCKGKITWLLHLVSVKIDVDENVVTSIRIFGIPLSAFMKKKDEAKQGATDKKESVAVGGVETVEKPVDTEQEKLPVSAETAEIIEIAADTENADAAVHTEDESEQVTDQIDVEEKQTLSNKISAKIQFVIQKIRELIAKIKGIFDKIRDTVINIREKKETLKRYVAILRSDTAKAAFSLCRKRIFRMLKHIFPRKMHVNLTYGMNDPADTGYILAVYGMLPEFVGKRIILHADFERPVFKGDFYLKGGIRAWTLLYQALCVILDKDCQKLYHIVKKEIGNERK